MGGHEYAILGKRFPKVDAIPKATGKAEFAADISLPGMLYGKVLRSPYPHAIIRHIDTSRAERLPGVKAVITGRDFAGFRYGYRAESRDEEPLATTKVRFAGDEVAAVAAIDPYTAEEAVELIEVEYEPLPPVLDPREAMEPGAPLVHDDKPGNISFKTAMNFGDVEAAFKEADYVREDHFYSQSVLHGFMEPHACVAEYREPGRITIWASKQSPYILYRNLASCFRVPLSNVRLIQPSVGGGFGGKNESFALDFCAVMLSKKTGRPVKIVYEAEDVLAAGRRRHPMHIDLKVACRKDGTLLAYDCRVIADGGAYTSIGPVTLYQVGVFLALPYKLQAFRYEGYRIYTNKPPCCAQRGNGIPQIRFAAECQLDLIARDLGIDPAEIRQRNAVEPGYVTVNEMKVKSCGLVESITEATTKVNWHQRRKELEEERRQGGRYLKGIGIACNGFVSGVRSHGHNACGVVMRVHEDGGVTVQTGATDSGQGAETLVAAVTAEILGISLDQVQVAKVDTLFTPVDPGSYGSRVTSTAGHAVRIAAEDARRQLAAVAAEKLGVPEERLEFRGQRVYDRDNPEVGMPFRQLCRLAYAHGSGQVIIGRGFYGQDLPVQDLEGGKGDAAGTYSFGTQIAEVEVDRLTGQTRLTKMIVAHDLGFAINPTVCEGQHDGSVLGGLGHAMYEQCLVEDGYTLNPSFLDYKMPTACDMPGEMESISIETHDPVGPFGAKESAEGTQISTLPAIINAIYDATGVMFTELPVTPEKILRALEEKEKLNKEVGQHALA